MMFAKGFKPRTDRSPFLFLFVPSIENYAFDFINYSSKIPSNGGVVKSYNKLNIFIDTLCETISLLRWILSKRSNVVIPRYRRPKGYTNMPIRGKRSLNPNYKYYGCLIQLSIHIDYNMHKGGRSNLTTSLMTWLYGSTFVYDYNKKAKRRTNYKLIHFYFK